MGLKLVVLTVYLHGGGGLLIFFYSAYYILNLQNNEMVAKMFLGRISKQSFLILNIHIVHTLDLFFLIFTVGGRDLNIKFPVIVFIHGESYEWNSGNPYDGSILASYGDVIVVTLNFRLGVLGRLLIQDFNYFCQIFFIVKGFLRPDLGENKVANFGLLDQIAALKWIQDNIGVFNGDRDSVTLLGHGTGAACVNLLLISPMAQSPTGNRHIALFNCRMINLRINEISHDLNGFHIEV